MVALGNLLGSFVLGVLTPLTAVCVLPLYPGFLAYLAAQGRGWGQGQGGRKQGRGRERGSAEEAGATPGGVPVPILGILVVLGVVAFMFLVGLVFSTVLEVSLTGVIATVSPIAFGILALLGLVLLADVDLYGLLPSLEPPTSRHPALSAFAYGFFFGAIVLPCNPAFVALFFARSLLVATPAANLLNFLAFGLGIGFPLLLLSLVSVKYGRQLVSMLTRHASAVNRLSGAILLGVSLYYLVVVFDVLGVA